MSSDVIAIFERTPWPVLVVDPEGMIVGVNFSARATLGDAVRPGETRFESVCPLEINGTLTETLAALAENTGHGKFPYNWENGSTASADTTVTAIPAGGFILQIALYPEQPTFVSTEGGDGPMDANLAHKQKLDCAMQLARTVALDFNNALTTILGHTSLLLELGKFSDPWRYSLMEIEKSAAKAAEIASDLGNFSRQEKDSEEKEPRNANLILQRCVRVFQKPENVHLEWSVQIENKLYAAIFDEAKIQQVIIKVLENSVQSIRQLGKITVTSRNVRHTEAFQDGTAKLGPGRYVCVEITDTGEGIPAEVQSRIFEPFFTTKGGAHRGLGLAWVYGIMTNHGGGVAVTSEPGNGTTVRLYLPATKKYVKEASFDSTDLCGLDSVLMVDDEILLLHMGQMVLSSHGYQAHIASSGAQALEILQHEKIDLVITDLVMPGMSGRELAEHVRQISPQTRLLFSSGYVRTGKREEEESYLQKPFTAQDLLLKVKEALSTPVAAEV